MRFPPLAVATLCLGLAACQSSGLRRSGAFTSSDRAAIVAQCDTWRSAMRAADWDAVAEQYAEHAVLMPPNAPAVHGRDAVRGMFASMPPITRISMEIVEIDGRGDLAYVVGNYTMTLQVPGVGSVDDRGKYIEIRRRGARGTWPITKDMYNSDLVVPE